MIKEHYCEGCRQESLITESGGSVGLTMTERVFDGKKPLDVKHTCGKQALYKHRPDYHQWDEVNFINDDHGRAIQHCTVCNCTRTLDTNGVNVLYYERNNIPFSANKMPLCQK